MQNIRRKTIAKKGRKRTINIKFAGNKTTGDKATGNKTTGNK